MTNITESLLHVREYIERRDFSGYDPYDALNSPLSRIYPFDRKYFRIALTQLLRRCPLNVRPLLGIRPDHNPKALGLFLEGYASLYRMDAAKETKRLAEALVALLDRYKARNSTGNGWGYNFDWQSKVFFIPKYTPTIVNSAFIGHALLDAWETMKIQKALDLVLPIKDFILKDLNRLVEGDSICFSYTPLDHYAVHNANLLGASLLCRISSYTNDSETRQIALVALAYSMHYQQEDGAWKYSEQHGSSWIDSFHTGFNLESIRWFLRFNAAGHYVDAYRKGVRFYAENFFLDDGTPKYYHNRIYPIDIHSPAQAISFFSGEGKEYRELTERILNWMMKNMYSSKGYFYFRKGKLFTNKIPYMRWSQAWAFRGLTSYLARVNHE
jgi:hypothetical protein